MNLVAHQFLSFNNKNIQIGNFIAEVSRGRNFSLYPDEIIKGILLHREIDSYTDSNVLVKKATHLFHGEHGKFSPIIIDVVFDYFLIKHWERFSDEKYSLFIKKNYQLILVEMAIFPPKLQKMLQDLVYYNWFKKYKTLEGIEQTLKELSRRTKFENNMGNALKQINLNYIETEDLFLAFFPQLIKHCKKFIAYR